METRDVIRHVPFFATLDEGDLAELEKICKIHTVKAGTPLFRAGDPSDSFYIVVIGQVDIRIPDVHGGVKQVVPLKDGDFFGEMGVLRNTPRMADAYIPQDTGLLQILKDDFDRLMAVNKYFSSMVMGCFLERCREAMRVPDPTPQAPAAPAEALVMDGGRAFTLFSPCGGAGTSFLAANAAMKLRDFTKERVLLVDADHQFGTLAMTLGVQPKKYITELLARGDTVFQPHHALDYVVKTPMGIDLLPAPKNPEEAGYITPEVMRTIMQGILKEYPYVIVDTTSVMEEPNLTLMDCSQEIFMITVPEVIALSRMVTWLSLVQRLGYSGKDIRIIVNKYVDDGPITGEKIAQHLNRKLLGVVHLDTANVSRSLNTGQLVVEGNPMCQVSVEISNLVRESIFTTEEEKIQKKKGSFWSWFG